MFFLIGSKLGTNSYEFRLRFEANVVAHMHIKNALNIGSGEVQ